jgi:hypothetical protein
VPRRQFNKILRDTFLGKILGRERHTPPVIIFLSLFLDTEPKQQRVVHRAPFLEGRLFVGFSKRVHGTMPAVLEVGLLAPGSSHIV